MFTNFVRNLLMKSKEKSTEVAHGTFFVNIRIA